MASTWEKRMQVLNEASYTRYDERTSTQLAAAAQLLLDRYQGDLRHLRAAAENHPIQERRLLKRV